MSDYKVGLVENEVFKVVKVGTAYNLIDIKGTDVGTLTATSGVRKKAFLGGKAVQKYVRQDGSIIFKRVPLNVYESIVKPLNTEQAQVQTESEMDHESVRKFIHSNSVDLKPQELVMDELKWKFLVRSAVRSKNIMMVGPSGGGKTFAARTLVKALDRPDFYFNLGSTQDPRATLIGNTQFSKESGTFFSESAFVTAIKTPNAVILLDELSRAHPDAWNILMTALDSGQRYIRLDEAPGSPIVEIADGVTFIATANIGSEYTSTRVMDRAILDRFVIIEMEALTATQELGLLKHMYPHVDNYDLDALSQISHYTRIQSSSEDGELSDYISTRVSIEAAGLLYDGFTLFESAEIAIYPFFSNDGGVDSERTHVKQFVQKFEKPADSDLYDTEIPSTSVEEVVTFDDEIPVF